MDPARPHARQPAPLPEPPPGPGGVADPGLKRPAAGNAAPPRVQGYRVLRPLGRGGMGSVWLAHEEALDRRVALKFLHAGQGGGGRMDVILREARAAARLNHPNILTVYHFGNYAGGAFIAMEYLEAGSLADEIARAGPMPWPRATRAVRDAALALRRP